MYVSVCVFVYVCVYVSVCVLENVGVWVCQREQHNIVLKTT